MNLNSWSQWPPAHENPITVESLVALHPWPQMTSDLGRDVTMLICDEVTGGISI